MNPQRSNAKDFFLNLSATVALYTLVFSLLNLLFTIINTKYPKITNGYGYIGSQSISWPVAILVIFFPLFIFLMWLLAKDYTADPEKRNSGIHKWLTYLTLFVAGVALAGDLITVLYYFIDGQELTTGFLLKVLALLVVAGSVFTYYISDIRGRLTSSSRMFWRVFSGIVIVGSIVWGFVVLGSPHTQRLYKYDEQKLNDLMNINNSVNSYYARTGALPASVQDLVQTDYYINQVDPQTQKPYEYIKTGTLSYQLCAEFNKDSKSEMGRNGASIAYPYPVGGISWTHPAGRHCFTETINPNNYPGVKLPV